MVRRLTLLAAFAAVTGCAGQSKQLESELTQLAELLPGRYTNLEQVKADEQAGREPHAALEVNIVPVYAPRISDYAYYVQESAADDPRRIFTQRFVAFKVVKDRGIVQSLWSFVEPVRWRDAHRNTDLFKSMTSQDLLEMGGCELIWKKTGTGFEAQNDQASCRVSSEVAGGRVRLRLRAELDVDQLSLAEQSFDVTGSELQGGAGEDPFYRFRRR